MGNNASTQSAVFEQWQRDGNTSAMKDADPKDVFGLQANFTWPELKDAYRRTARWVHPDKGGSEAMFNYVTDCFKQLAVEVKARDARDAQSQLQLHEPPPLYAPHAPHLQAPTAPVASTAQQPRLRVDPKSPTFGMDFNAFFEQNKLQEDEYGESGGYGDMMEAGGKRTTLDNPKIVTMKGGKFSAKTFNRAFEKETMPATNATIFKEPEILALTKRLEFTEIGGGKPDDYTHAPVPGRGGRRGGLAYTDYKVATTSSRLVDPRTVQARPDFKTIEEYSAHRDRIIEGPLTPEELAWKAEKQRAEEAREEQRLARTRQQDARYSTHYGELMRDR